MQNRRWYDENDKLNMLVQMVRNSTQPEQKILANEITKKVENYCCTAVKKRIQAELLKTFCLFKRRDCDHSEYVLSALEYLKLSPLNIRTQITNEVLANIIAGEYSRNHPPQQE